MTLLEACDRGIARLRLSRWAHPEDYAKIDILPTGLGPWLHLYSPSQPLIGEPTPQNILLVTEPDWRTFNEWESYDGPVNASEK